VSRGLHEPTNSLQMDDGDYWTAERSAAKALLDYAGYCLERERNRLAALGRIDHSHCHLLAFGQMRNAGGTKDGDMDKHVLAAIVAGDETKPLGVVEPLHLS